MLPFEFSDDVIENALSMSRRHFSQYYPYRQHSEADFRNRVSRPSTSATEITRKEMMNRRLKHLRTSGIYLIIHENGETVYVGLAADFHMRFTKGIKRHTEDCEAGCGHWGHMVVPTTGARMVGMPDGNCRFFILEEIDHDGVEIAQAEIDWYYMFRANGWADRDSSAIRKVSNSIGSLGAKGSESVPCVVCIIDPSRLAPGFVVGQHLFFPGQLEAEEHLGLSPEYSGVLAPCMQGYQNQRNGVTARMANEEEIASGAVAAGTDVSWRDDNDEEVGVDGLNRNCVMNWEGGYLDQTAINHLIRFTKGKYSKRERSKFKAIYQFVDGKWRYVAKTDSWKAGNRKRVEQVRYGFESDREAALARERSIIANGWQEFNKPNFDWQPPTS